MKFRLLIYCLFLTLFCGCVAKNSVNFCDKKVYTAWQFFTVPTFSGQIIECKEMGAPSIVHENSGPVLMITILGENGKAVVVKNFKSGKDAIHEINKSIGVDRDDFPRFIYNLRDSVGFD